MTVVEEQEVRGEESLGSITGPCDGTILTFNSAVDLDKALLMRMQVAMPCQRQLANLRGLQQQ
jgi:hypothetical protein